MTTKLQQGSIDTTKAILEVFLAYSPLIRLRSIVIFIEVAKVEGQIISALQRITGIPQSGFSRALSELKHMNWRKKPGLDLVTVTHDEIDARNHRVYLTQAGKFLVKQLEATISSNNQRAK